MTAAMGREDLRWDKQDTPPAIRPLAAEEHGVFFSPRSSESSFALGEAAGADQADAGVLC